MLSLHLDIAKPVRQLAGEHVVLVIAPFDRETSTKTGCFDETVVLDDEALPELGVLLFEQAETRVAAKGSSPASVAG